MDRDDDGDAEGTWHRPYVLNKDLDAAYRQMAEEETREAEALTWAEATVGDVADETR